MAAPQLPAPGSFLPGAGSNAAVTPGLEALLAVAKQLPGGNVSTTLTLDANAGGRAVPTGARHRIDTFGQAASGMMSKLGTDNLDVGRRVKLSVASSLRPVTLLHAGGGTEQFFLANAVPMVLASDTATIEVERQADGWHEVDRWWGTQDGAFRSWLLLGSSATLDVATQAEAEAGALDTRGMTPLKVRQAQLAKGWAAALPIFGGTFDPTKWLLYYDAGNPGFYRVLGSAVVGQAPTKRFSVTDTANAPTFGEYTHSLGGLPTIVRATLLCKTIDGGFLVGQEVDSPDLAVYASPTVVGWTTAFPVRLNTGAGYSNATLVRWSIVLRAYL